MKAAISLHTQAGALPAIEFFSFPGGERHVRLPQEVQTSQALWWQVQARVFTPSDIMDLLLVMDALRRVVPYRSQVHLALPYVPYARQDRVALPGEPLSIKVFCSLINSMAFDSVTVSDPHSEVTPALLERVVVVPASDYVRTLVASRFEFSAPFAVVAPDAGARKRVDGVAALLGVPVVYASKKRDPRTGALSGFAVDGTVPDMPLLVVDDICDGGGTFIALAQVLRRQTRQPLYLYVTHGLFTKGVAPLLALYDQVFTPHAAPAVTESLWPDRTGSMWPTRTACEQIVKL